ncbi:SOS-induced cell division inhibitor SulA [Proteus sp. DFP240708]|uniref:SOS-induced cell division inhibitor SulA n=1 Tax=Proteus TaxID=583 RepID=UPI0018E4D9AE|nr:MULTISPECIES: SOS-induced cell division inhibitor SulA [Proteus]MBI6217331.1 cell division inhibitor SulA [Proteus vulgaris]
MKLSTSSPTRQNAILQEISNEVLPLSIPSTVATYDSNNKQGMVSELLYQNPLVINHILLPLLKQYSNESRWLLWLNPQQKLNRTWLKNAGLPLNKIIQLNHINMITTVDLMEKALVSGNYSVVLGWLPEISSEEMKRLESAASKGKTLGFIMRQQVNSNIHLESTNTSKRHLNSVKIHSIHYH